MDVTTSPYWLDGEIQVDGAKLEEGDQLIITLDGVEYPARASYDPPLTLVLPSGIENSHLALLLANPWAGLEAVLARRP